MKWDMEVHKEGTRGMNKSVDIIELDGSPIVIINDIRFQSRRGIDWNKVEKYLKEYIGKKRLKGANTKAKANMTSAIGELIQIATEKAQYPDYNNKHGEKAKLGWYRYNTKFGIPVYDADGNLERYNIFSTRMLVRCDADGKLYLYDLVRTKKETREPHEQ